MSADKTTSPIKSALRLIIIALLIALALVLLPSAAIHSYAEVITLPIDESGGVPPYDWGYTKDGGYADPSITVAFEEGRFKQTNWLSMTVQVKDPSQVRTLKAGPYGSTQEVQGAALAKRVKAVAAFGVDFFLYHIYGYVVRLGQIIRNKPSGEHDVLIIDRDGNLNVLIRPDQAALDLYEKEHKASIVNAFTFGPALVVEGEIIDDVLNIKNDFLKAQRIALAQTGPLAYRVIYCEGPNDRNSVGLTMGEFAQLVGSFEDVDIAYNLDGGSSATIVFQNEKINGPYAQRMRSIGDIIFFASAWKSE